MKGILGVLLLLGIICLYWKWILAVVVVVWIVNLARRGYHTARAEAAEEWVRRGQLVARADQQHAWASEGDPRGTFGEYRPAV